MVVQIDESQEIKQDGKNVDWEGNQNEEKLYRYNTIQEAASELYSEYIKNTKADVCMKNVYESDLMFVIGGWLFSMAPNREPRNAEIIMKKVRDTFRLIAFNDNEWYYVRIDVDNIQDFIHDLLFGIKEFRDLNLSYFEYNNGVSVFDSNRGGTTFVSRFDVETPESWKDSFVCPDAFVRQVCRWLKIKEENA